MVKKESPKEKLHTKSKDLRELLAGNAQATTTWKDITPLARNEWICWIISAKKPETRTRRLRIAGENLAAGKRRPCCFSGCTHRKE